MSASCFPLLEGPSSIFLRVLPPGCVCVSDVDERAVSAVFAGGGGEEGDNGGLDGGVGLEVE